MTSQMKNFGSFKSNQVIFLRMRLNCLLYTLQVCCEVTLCSSEMLQSNHFYIPKGERVFASVCKRERENSCQYYN